MKRFYILLFFSVITFSAFSQAYKPMLKENKTWVTMDQGQVYTGNWWFSSCYYKKYSLTNDTIINGINYFKEMVFNNTITWGNGCGPPVFDTIPSFTGMVLREDSLTKKIWGKSLYSNDTSEYLIYDFSLNTGDTMTSYFDDSRNVYNSPHKGLIDSIVPILLNNGDSSRAFYITPIDFYSFDYYFYIMEGVGSLQGYASPFKEDFEAVWHLACVTDDNINLFTKSGPGGFYCGFILGKAQNNFKQKSFDAFPNPNNGEKISITGEDLSSIKIYNIHGQLIKTVNAENDKIELSLINQSKGIYLVKAQFNNGEVATRKLILTR